MPMTLGPLTALNTRGPISFVGAGSASVARYSTATLTLPSFNIGDLILVGAFADFSTVPTLPAGYTSLYGAVNTSGSYQHGSRVCYQIATSSTASTVSATNGSNICAAVYRNTPGIGAVATRFGSGSATYPSLTMTDAPGWIVGMNSHPFSIVGTNAGFVPAGQTSRVANSLTTIWDTAADVSSYASQTGASSASYAMSFSIELQ